MPTEDKLENLYANDISNNIIAKDLKFHPTVQQSLANIIINEEFITHEISKRPIYTNGGNYLAELFEVNINGETKDGNKEINLFLKHVIPGDGLKSILDVEKCYLRELFVYNELKHVFDELQEKADIPEKEKFRMVKSYDECHGNAIILDNVSKRGFKTLYRKNVMTLNFSEQAIIQLARLHGLTFAIEYKERKYFENKIKSMNSLLCFGEQWQKFVKQQYDTLVHYFDIETQKKLDKFLFTLYEKIPKYLNGETDSVKCMCHGDFKIDNIMFKENEDGEDELIIIDYQIPFYGSPVVDIIFLIFTGTDRKFRNDNMDHLKNLYHNSLANYLQYFNMDINYIYPKEVFEKDFDEALDLGLMLSIYFLPFHFTVDGEAPNFSKVSLDDTILKLDDRYRVRITELVEDYINWGLL